MKANYIHYNLGIDRVQSYLKNKHGKFTLTVNQQFNSEVMKLISISTRVPRLNKKITKDKIFPPRGLMVNPSKIIKKTSLETLSQ